VNGRKARALRKRSRDMFIEWLRTMTPEGEEPTKINKKNIHTFLPEQTHFYANRQFRLSAYTLRWFYKKLKRNPNLKLEDLNA